MSYGDGYAFPGQQPVYPSRGNDETDAQARARLAQEVGRLTAELRNVRAELEYRIQGPRDNDSELMTHVLSTGDGPVCVTYTPREGHYRPTVQDVWVGWEWWSVESLKPYIGERLQRALEAEVR